MTAVDPEQLTAYRRAHLKSNPVADPAGGQAFVQACGFCYAFTAGDGDLPALFEVLATDQAGQRWEWAWGWRDRWQARQELLAHRLIRGKPVLAGLDWIPAFYGLAGLSADPAEDIRNAAEAGQVGPAARRIHNWLAERGPKSTKVLLRELGDGSKESKRALEKGIRQLEEHLLIAALGSEGGNSIARIWDLFPRVWPAAAAQGAATPTRDAARRVLERYLRLAGAVPLDEVTKAFPWCRRAAEQAVQDLLAAGAVRAARLGAKDAVAVPELA